MSLELFLQNLGMYSAQIAVLVGAASALVWLARLESPRALLGLRQALLALCVLLPLLQTWRVPPDIQAPRSTRRRRDPRTRGR